jgi:hypothetical protein
MNNQPAFPSETMLGWESGMTLRDYFAAKAMQAHVADGELVDACAFMNKDFSDEVARISYKMADAMLKAREA